MSLTQQAFNNSDIEKGKKVMKAHAKIIAPKLDRMIEDIINDKSVIVRKAVICSLFSRYLKRVSAHLTNISSSVVNPFHKVGYSADNYTKFKDKNVRAKKN